jgi:hypothetical protein
MPYITQKRKNALLKKGHDLAGPGELNYILTRILIRYIEHRGLSYQTINDIIGALEGAKAEFYRRVAIPYEDKKRKQNGDVYKCLIV